MNLLLEAIEWIVSFFKKAIAEQRTPYVTFRAEPFRDGKIPETLDISCSFSGIQNLLERDAEVALYKKLLKKEFLQFTVDGQVYTVKTKEVIYSTRIDHFSIVQGNSLSDHVIGEIRIMGSINASFDMNAIEDIELIREILKEFFIKARPLIQEGRNKYYNAKLTQKNINNWKVY